MTYQQNLEKTGTVTLNITGEKTVDADIVKIPLHFLRLDPKNVRFKHMERALSDKELEEEIWKDADSKSLLREIKFSRGLSEMPFVKKITDNEFLVIEGNRRTTCLRKLAAEVNSKKEKDIPRERIDPVKCVVFPSDIEERDIALWLSRVHVSGKKDWAAMNKGAHVYDLIKIHGMSYDDVARAISIGKNTISQNVSAHEQTLVYHDRYPTDEAWLQKFSHFLEMYKKRPLKDWISVHDNMELFMKWINKGQIPMAIHVRKLDKIILENADAFNSLKRGGKIDHAIDLVRKSDSVRRTDEDAEMDLKNFQNLVQTMPREMMKKLASDKSQLTNLEELHKELGKLLKDIKALS